MWMVESSIPTAMMLLSWGWNAKNDDGGGGGMNVVITYKANRFLYILEQPKEFSSNPLRNIYIYLKSHHVEQGDFSSSSRHDIRVVLRESDAWVGLFKVYTRDIVGHEKTTVWLPMLRNSSSSCLHDDKRYLNKTAHIMHWSLSLCLALFYGYLSTRVLLIANPLPEPLNTVKTKCQDSSAGVRIQQPNDLISHATGET